MGDLRSRTYAVDPGSTETIATPKRPPKNKSRIHPRACRPFFLKVCVMVIGSGARSRLPSSFFLLEVVQVLARLQRLGIDEDRDASCILGNVFGETGLVLTDHLPSVYS